MNERKDDGRAGPGHAAEERFMDKDPNRFPGGHRPQASDTQTGTRPEPVAGDNPAKPKRAPG